MQHRLIILQQVSHRSECRSTRISVFNTKLVATSTEAVAVSRSYLISFDFFFKDNYLRLLIPGVQQGLNRYRLNISCTNNQLCCHGTSRSAHMSQSLRYSQIMTGCIACEHTGIDTDGKYIYVPLAEYHAGNACGAVSTANCTLPGSSIMYRVTPDLKVTPSLTSVQYEGIKGQNRQRRKAMP